ncbi:hypothetical protein P865_03785 [Brucella abortus 82]|nr:hypothetical protein M798_11545 [Brucella melitensis ADMAS-G1]ERM04739.1 hypothetical protein P408_10605 [Brucella abortus S99]ERM87193.1 hypothetical protein P865_03785 [Brucella abortus 82]EXU83316.1 hypothetical protein AX23_06920 [Brucella melitensis 548]
MSLFSDGDNNATETLVFVEPQSERLPDFAFLQ